MCFFRFSVQSVISNVQLFKENGMLCILSNFFLHFVALTFDVFKFIKKKYIYAVYSEQYLLSVWFAVIDLRITQHFAAGPRIPAFPSSGNPTNIATDQVNLS